MRMTADNTARTLIDVLRDRAAAQPHERAYTFLDDGERCGASMTWAQLDARSRAIAAAICSRVDSGDRVLVMFPPSLGFVPAFFATMYAGCIAVPVYPPSGSRADRTVARLRGMVADSRPTLVLAPAVLAAHLQGILPELSGLPWLDAEDVPDEAAEAWYPPRTGSRDVAFLQYTSGSTSNPRGVMVTHANLLHNLAQTHLDAGYDGCSVSVSWLPVNHDMGLINGVLQPAFSGCPAYLMSPAAFLQRPSRWLQAISRLGGTHSGAPNFAYDLCAQRLSSEECATLDLSSWRIAYNGSEPVRRGTLENFQMTFGVRGFRWESFSPAYGLAESTLLVTSVPDGVAPTMIGSAVASGVNPSARGVLIVDPVTHAPCATGVKGEIWVRGESVAAGYWNRQDETRSTFEAFTSVDGEGPYLRTGDLGFIKDDCLFVSGRLKDLIIIRGMKHYPQDIELTAERSHRGLRAGCCAAFSIETDEEERLAIVAELDKSCTVAGGTDLTAVLSAIRVAVASEHHVAPASVVLVPPGTVPKTTSGKLQRYLCRQALAAGALEGIAAWDEDEPRFQRAAS